MWEHGGNLYEFKEKKLTDFSANINPLGQPQSVRKALAACADKVMHYPDPFCTQLRESLAEWEQVPSDWIVCGNGAAEVIFKLAYVFRPGTVLIPAPTFSEYEDAVRETGALVKRVLLRPENDFALTDEYLQALNGVDMAFLCNPNNPVGNTASLKLLAEIIEECSRRKILLVLDECFMDFVSGGESAKPFLEKYNNIVIIKAFTKCFAVPGVRLGYALCSSTETVRRLQQSGPPWSVSVPAQVVGIAACGEHKFIEQTQIYVDNERAFLQSGLTALGIKTFESQTNFILFWTPDTKLRDRLLELGFAIRDCSNYRGLKAGFYRIAVRSRSENQSLLEAIRRLV